MKIEQPGFYRTRHGRIAEVVGRVTSVPQTFPWVGLVNGVAVNGACSWRDDGTYASDPSKEDGRDLVAYLGKTLRRLPDSEGWWWYEPRGGSRKIEPRCVVLSVGRLVSRPWHTSVDQMQGRWGDKIEPSGFDIEREIQRLDGKPEDVQIAAKPDDKPVREWVVGKWYCDGAGDVGICVATDAPEIERCPIGLYWIKENVTLYYDARGSFDAGRGGQRHLGIVAGPFDTVEDARNG